MKRIIIPVAVVVAVIAAVVVWRRSSAAPSGQLVVSGTVEATEARLGFQAPGRIAAIPVREGDRVTRGTALAELDVSELQARRAQAAARIDGANALLDEMRTGSRPEEIAQARSAVDAARERVADADRDYQRNRTLNAGGAVSSEVLQKSEAARTVAAAQLQQAREQLQLVQRGPRTERISAQTAQVREAESAVAAVDAALANARIIAPFDGMVTIRHHEVNETVGAGQPVVTVINPADRWVRVYVPENRIGAVHVGTPAVIRSDTYPGKEYPGRISFISPEAEFTPKNVQTAAERVRLVYAVKVRVEGDPQMELKPGLPVDVEIAVQPAAQ